MPNAKESPWWRGKHSNKVRFSFFLLLSFIEIPWKAVFYSEATHQKFFGYLINLHRVPCSLSLENLPKTNIFLVKITTTNMFVTFDEKSFSYKVGFFPSSCVEVIPGSIHDSNVRKPPTRVNIKCDVVTDGMYCLECIPFWVNTIFCSTVVYSAEYQVYLS